MSVSSLRTDFKRQDNNFSFFIAGNILYGEVDSGHSKSASFLGKDLSTFPLIALSSLHFTSFYVLLATPIASFGELVLLNMAYFYCESSRYKSSSS